MNSTGAALVTPVLSSRRRGWQGQDCSCLPENTPNMGQSMVGSWLVCHDYHRH